jgi:hypothetical protein
LLRVAFFEDRMRAVQVDLVKSSSSCRWLQLLAVRSHILVSYLLADVPSQTYEHSFGQAALQTALASYWNTDTSVHTGSTETGAAAVAGDDTENSRMRDEDDEILALTLLVQLNRQLLSNQQVTTNSAEGMDQMVLVLRDLALVAASSSSSSRRQGTSSSSSGSLRGNLVGQLLPKWDWALRLLVRISLGHYQVALAQLVQPPPPPPPLHHGSDDVNDVALDNRFVCLARCIMAPSLRYLQWRTVQAMSTTCLKGAVFAVAPLVRALGLAHLDAVENATNDKDDCCCSSLATATATATATAAAVARTAAPSQCCNDDGANARNGSMLGSGSAVCMALVRDDFGLAWNDDHDNDNDDGLVGKVGGPIRPLDTRSQHHHAIRPTWDALVFGRTPMISTDATRVAVPSLNWMERIILSDLVDAV